MADAHSETSARAWGGEPQEGVTVRSVGLGLGAVVVADLLTVGVHYLLQGSRLNSSHFPAALLIVFLAILVVSGLVRWVRPEAGLRPRELLLILGVGFLGTTAPNNGLAGFFIGVIAAPYYFATQENGWQEVFHAYIPS